MNKRGKVWKVILIILAILVIVVGGVALYLYNFHVFKTIKVCVSEISSEDTNILCASEEFCLEEFRTGVGYEESQEQIDGLPDFIEAKFEEVFSYAVFCENTCKLRDIRGLDFEKEIICNEEEEEFSLEIRGKEGLKLLSYIKSQEEN